MTSARRGPLCLRGAIGAVVLLVLVLLSGHRTAADGGLSIRITSPQGRAGLRGAIRIVAQVKGANGSVLGPVRFFVDQTYLGEDSEGPIYALEWVDDNPFEPRSIAVEVSDDRGHTARDTVALEAFEILETSEITSILLETTVQDEAGAFIAGLQASDFSLRENEVPQDIDLVRPEVLPATYTLLVDTSQSMASRMTFVRDAAAHIVDHLREQDRILVAPFKRQIGAVTGPTGDFVTVVDAIAAIQPGGGTAIADALADLARRIVAIKGRHVIVLITDGYDEHSQGSLQDAIDAVRRTQATLYVIGVGGSAGISLEGEERLKRVAAETGGRAFFPSRERELPLVHGRVASDVANRYLITYTPSNQRADGTWRAISLTTTDPSFKVRTRTGYQAPRPPPLRPTVEFSITDRSRSFLEISADDLRVMEDGIGQSVDSFHEASAPVSLILALDQSGSMKPAAEAAQAAARQFVSALRPEDSLGVILFSDRALFAHDLSKDRAHSYEAIDSYRPLGGTALYDSIYDALLRLKHTDTRRVLVLVTDGKDENNPGTAPGSTHSLEQAMAMLRDVDAVVYTIGIGKKVERPVLERLAVVSGGEAYFPDDVSSLAADFRRIVENLRRRYIVTYTSTNPVRDGSWRAVEIKTSFPDVIVKSRGGYFAPRQ